MSNNFFNQNNQLESTLKRESNSFIDEKRNKQNSNIANSFQLNIFSSQSNNPFQNNIHLETNSQNKLLNINNKNMENIINP